MSGELELPGCPICGKTPFIWHHRSQFGISNVTDVYCPSSDHVLKFTRDSEEEAIEAWKVRVESPELPEWVKDSIQFQIDELERILKRRKDLDVVLDRTRRDALENELRWFRHFLSLRRDD